MSRKYLALVMGTAAAVAAVSVAVQPAAAQTLAAAATEKPEASKDFNPPRTSWGVPDFQGIWENASAVPLERPKNLGSQEFYTPEEYAARQETARERAATPRQTQPGTVADVHYDLSQYGLNRRQVARDLRTSLIVGPDGRVPPMTPEAQKREAERRAYDRQHLFDGPENRGLGEQCILWPNEGPPMLPVGYNSNVQIVQGPGYVAIEQEMIHDVRMIPTDGSPHVSKNVRLWFGDSRGHWEGNTLVVDTTNFNGKSHIRGSDENLHVVERISMLDENTLRYQFTVDDPTTWVRPWSGEVLLPRGKGPIYEYACTEGNYGIANTLHGARVTEQKAAAAGAK
jgi:hypothetical protein